MSKTTICVLIMATNEEHCILETLNATLPYATDYIFCDNASTDNTIKVCEDFFKTNNIKGQIFNYKWVNFGHNYSYLYELGYKHSDSEYLWQIDADDLVCGKMDIGKLDKGMYLLQFGREFTYPRPQIFKNSIPWKHYLVLHGYVAPVNKKIYYSSGQITGEYYIDSRRIGNRHRIVDEKTKYLNDAKNIEDDLINITDKHDLRRSYFYLAQSYHDGGNYEKSIEKYNTRISMDGWDEEVFYSRLQVGKCYKYLDKPSRAISRFWRCYNYFPYRAEPLFEMGKIYYGNNDFVNSKKYLKLASKIPFPVEMSLFIQKDIYDYGINKLLACVYYSLKKYNKSYDINIKLLKGTLPDNQRYEIEQNNNLNTLHTLN